jgi:hypothetical protein
MLVKQVTYNTISRREICCVNGSVKYAVNEVVRGEREVFGRTAKNNARQTLYAGGVSEVRTGGDATLCSFWSIGMLGTEERSDTLLSLHSVEVEGLKVPDSP